MTDSAPPEGASPAAPAATPATGRWAKLWVQLKRFRGPIAAIAAFGAVLSGLLGYWSAYQTVEKVVVPQSSPAVVTADAGPLSIVVLPFTNLTGDANQAYVADGLTAALTADLSRIRDAFIVSTTTAFAYKDKAVTAQQVGRDLGVRFALQGGVQRSGTKIRINAQLADATSNAQLWSESFEGDQSDLFALQDQVTARIGNSIGREIVIVAARESESRKSNPKIADLMLRARALSLRPLTLANLQQEEDLYRQVLALEPRNASAMAYLAEALISQPNNFRSQLDESTKEKKFAEGRELALKAKEIDPDIPEIYHALSSYAANHDDYEGHLRAEETRLSLDPKNPRAFNGLAVSFFDGGQPQRAIELLTQAINLDPKHPDGLILSNMGRAYFMLGDNDEAIKWCLRAIEKNATFPTTYAYLTMAYTLKGEDSKARAAATQLRRLDPSYKVLQFEEVIPSQPAAFKEWYEKKLVPAVRKAGLPE
jgi:adenylate cyclase